MKSSGLGLGCDPSCDSSVGGSLFGSVGSAAKANWLSPVQSIRAARREAKSFFMEIHHF